MGTVGRHVILDVYVCRRFTNHVLTVFLKWTSVRFGISSIDRLKIATRDEHSKYRY